MGKRKWLVALRCKLSFISEKGDVLVLLEEVSGSGEKRGTGDNFVHSFS